jgi:hypothetical protein
MGDGCTEQGDRVLAREGGREPKGASGDKCRGGRAGQRGNEKAGARMGREGRREGGRKKLTQRPTQTSCKKQAGRRD